MKVVKVVKTEKNLVSYNIREDDSNDPHEREEYDRSTAEEIITDGIKIKEYKINKVIRMGKKDPGNKHPRPLLVKLDSIAQKWSIIKNAKNLKDDEYMCIVSVALDMNKEEQEMNKILTQQLREKRESGEQGWAIKNGKLFRHASPR